VRLRSGENVVFCKAVLQGSNGLMGKLREKTVIAYPLLAFLSTQFLQDPTHVEQDFLLLPFLLHPAAVGCPPASGLGSCMCSKCPLQIIGLGKAL